MNKLLPSNDGIFVSRTDKPGGGGAEVEQNLDDERSLSFSSSDGGDGDGSRVKVYKLNFPVDENGDVDNTSPVITVDSLSKIYAGHPSISNISTSANTFVMSNMRSAGATSPPNCIGEEEEEGNSKRSIFGKQTKKKYNVRRNVEGKQISQNSQLQKSPMSSLMMEESIPTPDETNGLPLDPECQPLNPTASKILLTPPRTPGSSVDSDEKKSNQPPLLTVGIRNFLSPIMSPLTPVANVQNTQSRREEHLKYLMRINDVDESSNESPKKEYAVQFDPTTTRYNNEPSTPPAHNEESAKTFYESHHHAQALLLSVAFFFIWSPQNLLAPNLTAAARDFGYGDDPHARDLYLGSNLALASSVLSLPVSALIGFASDVVPSRRILISVTTLVGGIAAIATGMSTTYPQLILSRFISGSCMSGSVPVVFSLLSDWFDDKDRNAASSGFTAMMGAGMILGQVYAGCTGPSFGWRHSFHVSGILTIICAFLVMVCVGEPVRGGKEEVLRAMLASGKKYEKRLTWAQFVSSMTDHPSNCLLMLQGFFSNIPWGVMFVFLNDYLSQEKGLTVRDATFIVAVFGFGCAAGGILGGYLGSLATRADRRYLPLFMAFTTLLGIGPYLALMDDTNYDHASLRPCFYAFIGGCLSSMPSVNVRPCIINVNPPEIRGAALTTANLIINAARGAGPSFLTTVLMGMFGATRASGFNITIIAFWSITSIQLALLAKTLPLDQERMETELANYANASMDVNYGSISVDDETRDGVESHYDDTTLDDRSLFSIENQATSFDARAAKQSLQFMGESLREIGDGVSFCSPVCCELVQAKQSAYSEVF